MESAQKLLLFHQSLGAVLAHTGLASIALSFLMLFVDLVLSGDEIWFATLTEECKVRVYLTTKCFGSKWR